MGGKLKAWTEDSVVPLSVGLLLMLLFAAMWTGARSETVEAHTKAIVEIKADQAEYMKTVQAIDSRLSRIEGAVGVKSSRRE